MIRAEKLSKYYGPFPALREADFQIEKGEIVGFLGPNGAGKTTTLRLLTGYLPPTSGTVRVAGFDVRSHSLEVRKRIGYLPETVPLYKEMTVRSFLRFMAAIRGIKGKEQEERVSATLEDFHLQDHARTPILKLSKGYRQLTGIAQAFVHEPEVLVLDEPTIGIDPRQVVEVRGKIKDYGRGHTVILSSHILPEISLVCDRVMVMNRGRIVAVDRPDRLAAALGGTVVYEIEAAGEEVRILGLLRRIPGVLQVTVQGKGKNRRFIVEGQAGQDLREALSSAVMDGAQRLLGLTTREMSLEDIFLRLTRQEKEEA